MRGYDKRTRQLYDRDDSQFIYYTVTGERIAIKAGENGVTEDWIREVKLLHRRERNDVRNEQKNISLDAVHELVGDKSTIVANRSVNTEELILVKEDTEALRKKIGAAMSLLTDDQMELIIKIRLRKQSISSIARLEGVHESSVRERLRRIEKKLRKFLDSCPPES